MNTFSEYIGGLCEGLEELEQFKDIPKRGKVRLAKDVYWFKSVDPKALIKGMTTLGSNPADARKAADKEAAALKKKKAFKDKPELFEVQKCSKGTYDYTCAKSKGPKGEQIEGLALSLGRDEHLVLDRWNILKLHKEGVLKFQ